MLIFTHSAQVLNQPAPKNSEMRLPGEASSEGERSHFHPDHKAEASFWEPPAGVGCRCYLSREVLSLVWRRLTASPQGFVYLFIYLQQSAGECKSIDSVGNKGDLGLASWNKWKRDMTPWDLLAGRQICLDFRQGHMDHLWDKKGPCVNVQRKREDRPKWDLGEAGLSTGRDL